ncbi:hypothetical protein PIB30_035404 [Stylosanthes scabra]|uniref:Uncharacterized protein n=1 Tax=Stylosanthes scabra TaxID=79078 RepID=A0ABU6QD55_9FABA|nr:hypothetical protein [Stylosanthes scabra]
MIAYASQLHMGAMNFFFFFKTPPTLLLPDPTLALKLSPLCPLYTRCELDSLASSLIFSIKPSKVNLGIRVPFDSKTSYRGDTTLFFNWGVGVIVSQIESALYTPCTWILPHQLHTYTSFG